jgi:hypothetical protein
MMGLDGDPNGEKPAKRVASRSRVLSSLPGDEGGACSSLVGILFASIVGEICDC